MEEFKNYLNSEFRNKIVGYTAVEMNYSFNENTKIDKKTNKHLKEYVLTIFIKYFDKDMNCLYQTSLKFINNLLSKSQANKLINISPKELENKYMIARKEICSKINKDFSDKILELKSKQESLKNYIGKTNILINREFQGEKIEIANIEKISNKKSFDM